ncbi:hypothetical protein PIB30_077910 [Stylosanthes scabra]|uniref:CCHC-type domain-containing protein n=1 Tax=Stylosanthes scabra TaxID=79078 RepID=A0ABU6TRE3_9FABA|nr:hypothetical protein [Stylosanthes scabra]
MAAMNSMATAMRDSTAAIRESAAATNRTMEYMGRRNGNNRTGRDDDDVDNGTGGNNRPMTLAIFLKLILLLSLARPRLLRQMIGFGRLTVTGSSTSSKKSVCEFCHLYVKGRCSLLVARGASGEAEFTWAEFRTEFYKKYFPPSARTAKELELLQLKQGNMTVVEYTHVCYNCGGGGHMARDCQYKRKEYIPSRPKPTLLGSQQQGIVFAMKAGDNVTISDHLS